MNLQLKFRNSSVFPDLGSIFKIDHLNIPPFWIDFLKNSVMTPEFFSRFVCANGRRSRRCENYFLIGRIYGHTQCSHQIQGSNNVEVSDFDPLCVHKYDQSPNSSPIFMIVVHCHV